MSYLKDFKNQIANHDYTEFLKLWEEYCASDELEADEVLEILQRTKNSSFKDPFGKYVEQILPLWEKLPESPKKHELFKLIVDLQTTNLEPLRLQVIDYLKDRYGELPYFQEKMRVTGLRSKDSFQGAVSSFELLSHAGKGRFVFHTGGWGVGVIVEISMLREQLRIEFDNVSGIKDLSFENACNVLIPLADEHFFSCRFGDPDALEARARENPIEVIHSLLRDLGPKTAAEIRDEMCDLVIPEKDWARWWQAARSKLKKDPMVDSPETVSGLFALRKESLTSHDRMRKMLDAPESVSEKIQAIYAFIRDFSEGAKEGKEEISAKLRELLQDPEIKDFQALSIFFLLEDLGEGKEGALNLIEGASNLSLLISSLEIVSLKKRALMMAKKVCPNWGALFLTLFFKVEIAPTREYILGELLRSESAELVKKELCELASYPRKAPELFLWYFQELMKKPELPWGDLKGKQKFFDGFLVLLAQIEQEVAYRDVVKKMVNLLTEDRFSLVREILKETTIAVAQEFLLLASKCASIPNHDQKILHSLAAVVHPKLQQLEAQEAEEAGSVIWTTELGYQKIKARMEQIATVETVENAKEVEVARSHGDLRENAEFKAALEKRSRLQSELRTLSEQIRKAKVIHPEDVSTETVLPGTVVLCRNKKGKELSYTILGPWDADPDRGIISFQSKLAQTMKGLSVGDSFQFQEDVFEIIKIESYFKQ